MLQLRGISCGYGTMQAVHRLTLMVKAGEITALLGANGSGKTSTIMCIAGHVALAAGEIHYLDKDIRNLTPMQRVIDGIGIVPEGRRLFSSLSVRENLVVGGYCRRRLETAPQIEKVLDIFPRLGERLHQQAGLLSGGEQQMLAIGRALMSQPKLLLIDELSLGLMPKVIDACYNAIHSLKREGMAILLVEQSTQRALEVSDVVHVIESGNEVWKGSASEARNSPEMIDACLGLV